MNNDRKSKSLWINLEEEILSFHPAEGFEELHFANHREMMAFAVEKTKKGFLIL